MIDDIDDSPEEKGSVVFRENDVMTVIQGSAEKVRQRFNDHLDETL